MLFGKRYKIVKAPHILREGEDNTDICEWTNEIYRQEYFLFIPLGWVFEDKFKDRNEAVRYIEYQLNPTYYP